MEILEKDKRRMFELLNKTVNYNADQLTITKDELVELAKYMRSYLLKDLVDVINPENAVLFSSEFIISNELSANNLMSHQFYLDNILISDAFLENLINKKASFCRFINGLSHELGHILQYFASQLKEFRDMADEEGLLIISDINDHIGTRQFSEFLKILDSDNESRKLDPLEFGYAKLTDPNLTFSLYHNLSFEKSARSVGIRLTKQFLANIKNEEMCSQKIKNNVVNWAEDLKQIIMIDELDTNKRQLLDKKIQESQEEESWLDRNRDNISESEYVERCTKLGMKKYKIEVFERRLSRNINELFDKLRREYDLSEVIELYERYKNNVTSNGEKVKLTEHDIHRLYFYGMSIKDKIEYHNRNRHKKYIGEGELLDSIKNGTSTKDWLKIKNNTPIDTM